jgi:hypothetical protein
VLFQVTHVISVIEKIKNLFLWTDGLLTFYFWLMIVCLFFIAYSIKFKYLMLFSLLKKFITGMSFYKRKYVNNIEVANIVLRHCHQEWSNETKNKIKTMQNMPGPTTPTKEQTVTFPTNSQQTTSEIKPEYDNDKEIDNIKIYDDKFRLLIKDNLEKHVDILIKIEFLNSVTNLGEIKEAISKSKTLLKVRKNSPLILKCRDNPKILKSPIDIENIFYYFIQNCKSDYYISKYYKSHADTKADPRSFSSVSFNDIPEKNLKAH